MGSLKNICSNSDIETLCRSPNLRAFPSSQSNPTHCAKRSVMPIRYVYNSYIRMSSGLISEGPIGIERGLAAPPPLTPPYIRITNTAGRQIQSGWGISIPTGVSSPDAPAARSSQMPGTSPTPRRMPSYRSATGDDSSLPFRPLVG